MIIATAQGMLARFSEGEVRPMGRDAAGVIGIRLLARKDDNVVSMTVVKPEADLLVLTETGYGKRVALTEFRRKHRGGQGVRLIALEGRRPASSRPSSRSRPRTRSCVLISAHGQVIRTETNTINRYSSSARGVIVMRLADEDKVVAIAAFSPGLAERGGMGDNDDPQPDGGGSDGQGSGSLVVTAFGQREAAVYADQFEIYHGNANPELARKIAHWLNSEPGQAEVFQFANENIFVRILDNVREKDVFLVQPTCRPVNQSIMELLIMIDAFKRASAGRITAVVPYYAYGRSDKKDQPRVPITARLVADMITVAGADRVLTMDLHQGQIQGFFNIPVDELTAVHMLSRYFIDKHLTECVVVTDLGFAKRARAFAEILDAPLAIVEKRRHGNLDRAEVINVIGEVHGRRAIIVDDEVDTAGTLIETVRALEREGVTEIYACATARRAVRPRGRADRELEPARARHHRHACRCRRRSMLPQIKVLSVAPLIGEAIKRIHRGESVGALFSSEVSFTQEMLLWEDGPGSAPTTPRPTTTTYHHRWPPRPAPDRSHRRPMSLQLHRPDGKGGLEPRAVTDENWHNQLRSPRWGASLKGGKLPRLANPEMNPTSTARSVAFWLALGVITFAIIVVGYGSSYFAYPPTPTAAPVVTAAPVTDRPGRVGSSAASRRSSRTTAEGTGSPPPPSGSHDAASPDRVRRPRSRDRPRVRRRRRHGLAVPQRSDGGRQHELQRRRRRDVRPSRWAGWRCRCRRTRVPWRSRTGAAAGRSRTSRRARRIDRVVKAGLIVGGVLSAGTAFVFAAAALTATLFPTGAALPTTPNEAWQRLGWAPTGAAPCRASGAVP